MQHRLRALVLCALGTLVTVLDTSAAVVALPTIAAELGVALPAAQWIIVGNSLTIAILLVPMGRLADLLGRNRIYVAGCLLFAVGACAAAFAPVVGVLIAARAIVGIGSAMTQGTAMAIIVGHFGVGERARALGWQTAAVGGGAMAGPALGGVIVSTLGWRALFVVTAVAMSIVALLAVWVLRERGGRRETDGSPFDFAGALLFGGTIASGLLTLTLVPESGWGGVPVLTGAASFAMLLAAFVAVERRHRAPMLDLAMFRNGTLALGAIGILVAFMGVSASRFLAPFFLQQIRGLDASTVGLLLMPAAAITALVSPVAGRLADRFGTRQLASAGFAVAILGLLIFSGISIGTKAWIVCAGLMVLAFGLATFSAPNSASIFGAVDGGAHGVTAAFINLCRNLGNVIGITLVTTIIATRMVEDGHSPSLRNPADFDKGLVTAFMAGFRLAYLLLIGLALSVFLLMCVESWRARRRPA